MEKDGLLKLERDFGCDPVQDFHFICKKTGVESWEGFLMIA